MDRTIRGPTLRKSLACLLAVITSNAFAQIGPNFPAHQRPEGDPAVVERGKTLYQSLCRACHGADLRGGDVGGPNLLRSALVLGDQAGELISPVVREGRNPPGGVAAMPPQPGIAEADLKAIAEYIHGVARTTQSQGGPPRGEAVPLNLLVGDAKAGEKYFNKECASCHSITGDLARIGARVTDIGALQDSWLAGRRAGAAAGDASRRMVRVTVKFADGSTTSGTLGRLDDFTVSLIGDDGVYRSYTRRAATPRITDVQVSDPLAQHRALWAKLADKDMHDVTAYLAGLK
jgi:cytochrome c oxidase cbb3-type subunit 3